MHFLFSRKNSLTSLKSENLAELKEENSEKKIEYKPLSERYKYNNMNTNRYSKKRLNFLSFNRKAFFTFYLEMVDALQHL